jgi:hypothetical protein
MLNNQPEHERSDEEESQEESYTESEKLEHLKRWENSNLETLLKKWGEKAGGQRWMHLNSASYWRSKDQKLNMFGIVLSSIVSASSMIGAFETYVDQSYVMTFVGFIGMLNILNQSLLRFYNCTEKAAAHETAARQFGNFQRYITTKLSLSRMDRGPPKFILDYALRENDRLYKENTEPCPKSIYAFYDHFQEKINDHDFSIPDYVSDTLRIDVFEKNPTYCDLTFRTKRKSTEVIIHTHDPTKNSSS